MAVMIEPRNDDRIDGLAAQVAALTVRVDEGFRQVDKRFEQVDKRLERLEDRFERLEDQFERLQRMLFGAAVAVILALIGAPHL